jgi:hypothetical protein
VVEKLNSAREHSITQEIDVRKDRCRNAAPVFYNQGKLALEPLQTRWESRIT